MLTIVDLSGNGKGVGFVAQSDTVKVFTAAGQVSDWARVLDTFNVSLRGTFSGEFILERSLDGGHTANRMTALGTVYSFTAPCEEVYSDPQNGVLYRWHCLSLASGSATGEISQ